MAARRSLAHHEVAQAIDHEAIGLFGADGHAQCVRQAELLNARSTRPRLVRNASASAAVLPFSSGKWIRMKFATLGVTLRPSFVTSSVSQLRHFSVCAFDIWTCAVSSIAAAAASIAGVETLKGPRMRLTASTIWAGPNIHPIRSAAR